MVILFGPGEAGCIRQVAIPLMQAIAFHTISVVDG